MSANESFFAHQKPAAVLKHGILARYAIYFAGRAGSRTKGVAFIDGYAGEGRYEDGTPGSPLLLASQAKGAAKFGRDVRLAFVEADKDRRQKLHQSLREEDVSADQVVGGPVESVLEALLKRYRNDAVLFFADPFGLGLPRRTLEHVLRRRRSGLPTDVIYHFSVSTLGRMGRAAVAPGPTSESNATQVDAALGDIDWRSPFRSATYDGAPTRAALEVAADFRRSIQASTGMRSTAVAVRQRPDHLPKYLLILFSGNDKAHWDYADVAGSAYVDWLHRCNEDDYEANLQACAQMGQASLLDVPLPGRADIDLRLAKEAEQYLNPHLANLIEDRGTLRPVDHIEAIYGEFLGRARETHVRSALKQLFANGLVAEGPTKTLWKTTIKRA